MQKKQNNDFLTHSIDDSKFSESLKLMKSKIIKRGDLPNATAKKQLEIIEMLSEFPLGRFMIEHRGLNGFWTDYIISNPNNISPKNSIEEFLIYKCPLTLATRDRFNIFQKNIQNNLKNNMHLASIPCGCMRDLLSINYSNINSYKLIGIDIDENSLTCGQKLAKEKKLYNNVEFLKEDAWNLNINYEIDLITSNGLNVYEPDLKKVIALYSEFYRILKKNGLLIIGVLTYPPGFEKKSSWQLELINKDDLLLQKIIFENILESKWQNYRTHDEIINDFKLVGFKKIIVEYDKYHIFPTIIAKK